MPTSRLREGQTATRRPASAQLQKAGDEDEERDHAAMTIRMGVPESSPVRVLLGVARATTPLLLFTVRLAWPVRALQGP